MKTDNQLSIDVPIEHKNSKNYVEELARYEKDKANGDYYPISFSYLPSEQKYSATRFMKKSLLESFNFRVIEYKQ